MQRRSGLQGARELATRAPKPGQKVYLEPGSRREHGPQSWQLGGVTRLQTFAKRLALFESEERSQCTPAHRDLAAACATERSFISSSFILPTLKSLRAHFTRSLLCALFTAAYFPSCPFQLHTFL